MRIVIKNIVGLMPDEYVETILTDQNVQKIGLHEEILLTDGKHRLTTELNSIAKERRVQALIYDKYRLRFVVKSIYTIELMNHGDVVIKDDDNHSEYHATILNINKSQIAGRFSSVEVEFYDTNPQNYTGDITGPINYLESNYVLGRYGFASTMLFQVWDIGTAPQPFYTIHSIITPDFITDQPETVTIAASNGALVRPNVVLKQFVEGAFYLKEKDKQDILSLLPLAGDRIVKAQMRVGGSIYNLLETPDFESTKLKASDLWELKIKYAYKVINHYEYSKT